MDEKKLKRIFQVLCHDTKGSIGASASLIKMLEKKYAATFDDKDKQWFALINEEYQSAQFKLTAFREFAQLFDCDYEVEPCDVEAILMACAKEEEALRITSGSQQFDIMCDSIPFINTSPELLAMFYSEVFANSLEHACVPISASQAAQLKCKIKYETAGNYHKLIYVDNGSSLSADKLNHIQQPYKSSLACSHAHCGMGFSKLHRISELLGGHMNVSLGEAPYTGLRVSLSLERN